MGQFSFKQKAAGHRTQTGRRVYDLLKSQIVDGTFPAGSQLPSTRGLASELGVSRTTVTAAYDQLIAEGFLETSRGTRARVCAGAAQATPAGKVRADNAMAPRLSAFGKRVIGLPSSPSSGAAPAVADFLCGALSSTDFPVLSWRKTYSSVLLQKQARLSYAAPEGEVDLRSALQGYLRRARGLVCDPDQILIVQGTQQALDLCTRVLVDPGDSVVVEDPCYPMARRVFAAAGAVLQEVPTDEHGLATARLPSAGRTRLAYVTPSHQFPIGGVMPIVRRHELLAWAARRGVYVVEDDYDSEFRYGSRPIDALQSLDTFDSVIYVGTFSKTLSPQMRLGYMVLPRPLVDVFRATKGLVDRHAPRLDQLAVAALIHNGTYERHIRRVRRENERRRAALIQAVARHLPAAVTVEGDAAGLHVLLWLACLCQREEAALIARARQNGVGVYPITPLYAADQRNRRHACAGLVLGYASLTPAQIDHGIRVLARVVRQMTP